MPTVLHDSGELIQCLERIELPANCILVTADVSSLYPNIDTKKAIIALDLLLREGKVAQTALLVQLTRIVFANLLFYLFIYLLNLSRTRRKKNTEEQPKPGA